MLEKLQDVENRYQEISHKLTGLSNYHLRGMRLRMLLPRLRQAAFLESSL